MALTKEDLAAISTVVQEQIDTAISNLVQGQIEPLRKEVRKTSLLLENDVLPRLQNIESCYTTTYRRYVKGIDQIETMQTDIDVLKDVVAEHSKILRKIS
ncbi:MAG: hypothetical protein LIO75_08900 [Lachnospiraceae bacterium]|nr:hypothetical protein [Lachnospiraceae bacterium]